MIRKYRSGFVMIAKKRWGLKMMQRKLSIEKLTNAIDNGHIAVSRSSMKIDSFLYSIGYNAALTSLRIRIALGEFDEVCGREMI